MCGVCTCDAHSSRPLHLMSPTYMTHMTTRKDERKERRKEAEGCKETARKEERRQKARRTEEEEEEEGTRRKESNRVKASGKESRRARAAQKSRQTAGFEKRLESTLDRIHHTCKHARPQTPHMHMQARLHSADPHDEAAKPYDDAAKTMTHMTTQAGCSSACQHASL